MLRRIFGPKKEEVTQWRQLHNEKFHNFYSLNENAKIVT
jgi:hypothetical protein